MRIEFHDRNFYYLRNTPEVIAYLEAEGERVCDAANETLPDDLDDGYMLTSHQGARNPQGRWIVRVWTATNHAKRSNALRDTLRRLL